MVAQYKMDSFQNLLFMIKRETNPELNLVVARIFLAMFINIVLSFINSLSHVP